MNNNNNPDEMSNMDLENDMQQGKTGKKLTGNQEDVSLSTAAEGTLKTPPAGSQRAPRTAGEERDVDDLVHQRGEEDSQDGSLPNPDDTPEWEDDEIDDNKISS